MASPDPETKVRAGDLLAHARAFLARQYPDALIVRELSVGNWGAAMLDVAAIREDEIIGVEIKGDGDSTTRLGLQASLYSKAADRMWLLPSPAMENRCFEGKNRAPGAWGRLVFRDGKVRAHTGSYGVASKADRLHVAPGQMLEALWKEELLALGKANLLDVHRRDRVDQLSETITEILPLRDVRKGVCRALRERDWGWRSGGVGPTSDPDPGRAVWANVLTSD